VQSGHFRTEAPVYPLKEKEEILEAAAAAREIGAHRFSLVTSGRGPSDREVDKIATIIETIRKQIGIKVCASLGIMTAEQLQRLKDAGMSRYHHNLEAGREFFDRIVSTHSFEERVDTIRAAQQVGLEVCAGGIVGLGETEADRISLAVTLRDLAVDSVPFNILIPLPGTPLAHLVPLSPAHILRAIALFRIICRKGPLRLCAGRESALGDFLAMAFMAGADGMMIGGYLTQRGRMPAEDHRLVAQVQELWRTSIPG
jgi:biotin synthase